MSDEWAKTTGKGIDAGRELGQFLAPIVRAPLENAMGIVADKLAYMRWERQQRLMKRAHKFMLEQGIEEPTRAVPMNIAIPLMQAASMEQDDVLQDTWARLLVNAIDADSGVDMKRSFVSILEELSPFEALILGKLCDASSMHGESVGLYTADLPDSVRINKEDILGKSLSREVRIALWNLARLGCIHPESIYGGPDSVGVVTVTSLGEAFIKACTLKPKG